MYIRVYKYYIHFHSHPIGAELWTELDILYSSIIIVTQYIFGVPNILRPILCIPLSYSNDLTISTPLLQIPDSHIHTYILHSRGNCDTSTIYRK